MGSVAAACRREPIGERTIRGVVFDDAVIRLVGEEHIAIAIDRGAFREDVAFAQHFDLRSVGDEARAGVSGVRGMVPGK